MLDRSEKRLVAKEIVHDTEVPPNPPTAFKLISLLRNKETNTKQVVEVIKYDADITSRLLKICNSAAFRRSTEVSSIDQAVNVLGYSKVLEIISPLALSDMCDHTYREYLPKPNDLWRHSVVTAICSKFLAFLSPNIQFEKDTAFTAGLLHDIGKTVLNRCDWAQMSEVAKLIHEKYFKYSEAEMEILKTDHAEIGAVLLEQWNLPELIVQACHFHNAPANDPSGYASLIHIASQIANFYECEQHSDNCAHIQILPEAVQQLNFTQDNLSSCLQNIKAESNFIESFILVR
jgi:putative nucleotidyltransferase with HDIG domain